MIYDVNPITRTISFNPFRNTKPISGAGYSCVWETYGDAFINGRLRVTILICDFIQNLTAATHAIIIKNKILKRIIYRVSSAHQRTILQKNASGNYIAII